jgi:peptide/nickel transport system substrate-binding protein
MKLRKYVVTTVALFALLSTSLAACGSNGSNGNSAAADGTLVVGADQEPECLDWIATCGGTSWGTWAALVTTLPQAYFSHASSGSSAAYVYEPSPLLAGEATVAPGDKQILSLIHI